MKLLLDTCSLLWALHDPKKLSRDARNTLVNPQHSIHVSVVSFWEISLKYSIGKLTLENVVPGDFPAMVEEELWEILPLTATVAADFHGLPKVGSHKDPFDRMLIHLAIRGGYHFVSKDAAANDYSELGLRVCW